MSFARKFIPAAMVIVGLLLAIGLPLPAAASGLNQSCAVDPDSTLCQESNDRPGGSGVITGALRNIANLVSIVAGIVGVGMILIGGFRYIRSSGDPSKISEAQNTIIYAIIGLVVAASGQLLVAFVLNKL